MLLQSHLIPAMSQHLQHRCWTMNVPVPERPHCIVMLSAGQVGKFWGEGGVK